MAEHAGQGQDEKHSSPVAGDARESQTSEDECREEAKHEDDAEEAPLLPDDRQDEVGVLDGKEPQLALRARPEALSGEAPRADRDLGLPDLVTGLQDVMVGVQERLDPLLLVVLQEEPTGPREHRDRDEDRDPSPRRQPPEEKSDDQERQEGQREPQVRLRENEQEREADDRAQLDEGGQTQARVVLILEEIRDEQRRRDLGELGRLKLEASETDP